MWLADPGGAVAHGVVAEDEASARPQIVALSSFTGADSEGGLDLSGISHNHLSHPSAICGLPDVSWGCGQHPHRLLYDSSQVGQSQELNFPAPRLQRVQLSSEYLLLPPVGSQEVEDEDDAVGGRVHTSEQKLSGNRGDHFCRMSSPLQIPHKALTSLIHINRILYMPVCQTLE